MRTQYKDLNIEQKKVFDYVETIFINTNMEQEKFKQVLEVLYYKFLKGGLKENGKQTK